MMIRVNSVLKNQKDDYLIRVIFIDKSNDAVYFVKLKGDTAMPIYSKLSDLKNDEDYTVVEDPYEFFLIEDDIPEKKSGNEIIQFTVPGQIGTTIINKDNNTIDIIVGSNVDLSTLKPSISVSPGASITPSPREIVDFSKGSVDFIVIAENGSPRTWIVSIIQDLNNESFENDILAFSFAGKNIFLNPTRTCREFFSAASIIISISAQLAAGGFSIQT